MTRNELRWHLRTLSMHELLMLLIHRKVEESELVVREIKRRNTDD